MFRKILPRETSFFDYFEQHSALMLEACQELLALTSGPDDLAVKAARIKDLERAADQVTHRCIEALHKTFITPIDRADIHNLIKRLDDVIDSIESATSRIVLYELAEMRPEAKALAEVLVRAASEIGEALKCLRNLKNAKAIQDHCVAIYHLENEGDAILRAALVRLFREENAILVIKWKEIYERLEKATDRCEAVANIIQGVVIEAS
jgi:uncharacterized protein